MNLLQKIFSLSVLSLTVVSAANADMRINGFANFTGGITASDDSLYGFDDTLDFTNQSLFGIQLSGDVTSDITATGQLVARGSDDFSGSFEWAYLTYSATENTSISAGRLRMPLFRYSASLDVGYSYHWVLAPQSVYNVPFNNIDGIRIDHTGYAGDWEYGFQVATGQVKNDFTLAGEAGNINIDNIILATADLGYENWKFRGVYATGKVTFDLPSLQPTLDQLGQISADLSGLLAANEDSGVFYGGSIEYDAFDWFISGEYTGVEIEDSFYPKEVSYYVTAGFRTGKWTPFATYEKSDLNRDPKFVSGIANLPEPFQLPATMIVVGVQQSVVSENSTVSLGVRYDFDTNIAITGDISKNTNDISDDEDTLLRVAVSYVF